MAAGAAMIGLVGLASAQTPTPQMPGVEKRQAIQQQRIEQGIQSGQLTKKEAARLQKQQQKIEADEQKALADGTVTKQERAKLHREQNLASQKIYRQKHDRQKAAPAK
jgi:hypothetical protein